MSLNRDAGVDYSVLGNFKKMMVKVAERTRHLCERRSVFITSLLNAHSCCHEVCTDKPHRMLTGIEGLGNKADIARRLNALGIPDPAGRAHFGGVGIDTLLVGVNDNLAHGGLPVVVCDEITAGSSSFFTSPAAAGLAWSFEQGCNIMGCAMGQGESAPYVYLLKEEGVSASISVTSIVMPRENLIDSVNVRAGDVMIGFMSAGLQANGISPTIRFAENLPEGFATPLNGHTLGEECLIATRSYVGLMSALQQAGVWINGCLPVTGNAVRKLGIDGRYHFRVTDWPKDEKLPPLFQFYLNRGVSRADMAETYNCGIGWITMVPQDQVDMAMKVAAVTKVDGSDTEFYTPMIIGRVEKGVPGTSFDAWGVELPPPHE